MTLGVQEHIEAELGVLPSDLGLDVLTYSVRFEAWQSMARSEFPDDSPRQLARVKALLLRSWITALSRKADKFRAEGEITVERDMMARIKLLQADLLTAQLASLPEAIGDDTFGPAVGEWGVR